MYSYNENVTLKVFSRLYVGLRDQGVNQCKLGFATPYETNAAGRKRQETVDRWVGTLTKPVIENNVHVTDKNGRLKYEPIPNASDYKKVVDNNPREGWKVTDDVKRVYFGGGNVVWRVYDPNGYELEISSSNLMALIQVAGVHAGGVIPGKCILGRDSSGINVLLHEESAEYKTAILNAENLKRAPTIKAETRSVGTIYQLQNGSNAVYIGKVHVCVKKELPAPEQPEYKYNPVDMVPVTFDSNGPAPNHPVYELARHRYELLPSVQYEAVMPIQDGKLSDMLVLYKKAPLVSECGSIELPSIDNKFLRMQKSSFASANNYSQIASVTVNPIVTPVFSLIPWHDDQYDELVDQIKNSHYFNNLTGGRLSRYQAPFYYYFTNLENSVMVLGDVTCADWLCYLHEPNATNHSWVVYGAPVKFDQGNMTRLNRTSGSIEYAFKPAYAHKNSLHYLKMLSRNDTPQVLPFISEVKTVDDLIAVLQKLKQKRAMFTISVRDAQ